MLAPKKTATIAATRASTQKAKEEAVKKQRTTKKAQEEPKKKRKFVAQPDSDEEDQSEKVSHPPKPSVDALCQEIRNGDLTKVKEIDFDKFTKEEKEKIEESVYAMMA